MHKKARRKRCILHFNLNDVAEACNISIGTLLNIRNKEGINIKYYSLMELIEFIDKYKKKSKE